MYRQHLRRNAKLQTVLIGRCLAGSGNIICEELGSLIALVFRQIMKLHAVILFTDVTEGDFIFKLEISNGVYRNSGNVEIVVSQKYINRVRRVILFLAGCITNGNPSFADIDNGADCNSGGSWEGNDAVWRA